MEPQGFALRKGRGREMQSSFPIHNPSSKRRLPTGPSSPQKVINTLHQTKTHHLDMHAIIWHGKINPQMFFGFFFSFSLVFNKRVLKEKQRENRHRMWYPLYVVTRIRRISLQIYMHIFIKKSKEGKFCSKWHHLAEVSRSRWSLHHLLQWS